MPRLRCIDNIYMFMLTLRRADDAAFPMTEASEVGGSNDFALMMSQRLYRSWLIHRKMRSRLNLALKRMGARIEEQASVEGEVHARIAPASCDKLFRGMLNITVN